MSLNEFKFYEIFLPVSNTTLFRTQIWNFEGIEFAYNKYECSSETGLPRPNTINLVKLHL